LAETDARCPPSTMVYTVRGSFVKSRKVLSSNSTMTDRATDVAMEAEAAASLGRVMRLADGVATTSTASGMSRRAAPVPVATTSPHRVQLAFNITAHSESAPIATVPNHPVPVDPLTSIKFDCIDWTRTPEDRVTSARLPSAMLAYTNTSPFAPSTVRTCWSETTASKLSLASDWSGLTVPGTPDKVDPVTITTSRLSTPITVSLTVTAAELTVTLPPVAATVTASVPTEAPLTLTPDTWTVEDVPDEVDNWTRSLTSTDNVESACNDAVTEAVVD
jgi:hypothetical protein